MSNGWLDSVLVEGDSNSKFFHGHVSARAKKNLITEIQNVDGGSLPEEDEIIEEFISFF